MARDTKIQENVSLKIPKDVTIKQVTYAQLKNTGNYENERIELTAEVRKGQCPNGIAVALKERANDILHVLERVKEK